MKITFSATDSWQNFLDFGWPINVALGIDPDESLCDVMTYLRALGDVSIQEASEKLSGQLARRAAVWFLLHMHNYYPDASRQELIRVVCEDPPIAAVVYDLAKSLTERERVHLWAAFCDTMPVAVSRMEAPHA